MDRMSAATPPHADAHLPAPLLVPTVLPYVSKGVLKRTILPAACERSHEKQGRVDATSHRHGIRRTGCYSQNAIDTTSGAWPGSCDTSW